MALRVPERQLDVESDVADYAIGLAYVAHLGDEGETLELLGLDPAAWQRAQAWTTRLVEAALRQDTALAASFGAAFVATKERLGEEEAAAACAETSTSAGEGGRERALGPGLAAQLSTQAAATPSPPTYVAPLLGAPPRLARSEASPNLDTTMETRFTPGVPALPFDRDATSGLAAPASRRIAPPREEDLDATLEGPLASFRPPLPFVTSPTSDAGDDLTIEQYASLCVALDAFPAKSHLILQRYGLATIGDIERLHDKWQTHFSTDASSRIAWQAHVQAFRARLSAAK